MWHKEWQVTVEQLWSWYSPLRTELRSSWLPGSGCCWGPWWPKLPHPLIWSPKYLVQQTQRDIHVKTGCFMQVWYSGDLVPQRLPALTPTLSFLDYIRKWGWSRNSAEEATTIFTSQMTKDWVVRLNYFFGIKSYVYDPHFSCERSCWNDMTDKLKHIKSRCFDELAWKVKKIVKSIQML